MNIKEKQNEIAGVMTRAMIEQYKTAAVIFPDPGQRLTLAMGVAMVGVTATCQLVLKDGVACTPDRDEIMFGCLLISNSVEFMEHDTANDALVVEFSLDNIIKTIDQFRDITGRSIEDHLNESLVHEVNEMKAKAVETLQHSPFKPQ